MVCDRAGALTYMVLVLSLLVLIGLLAGMQMQLDQQVGRARTLKAGAEAFFLARHGLDGAARQLAASGSLPRTMSYGLAGGEVLVVCEGPRPTGSRKYVAFARGRHARCGVTLVADMREDRARAVVASTEVRYQDLDIASAAVRARVVAERAAVRRDLVRALAGYRAEREPALAARLDDVLASAAAGRVSDADRSRIRSTVPSRMTTALPGSS
jgi:hypothetical protein